MVETIRHRGPDDEGIYVGQHVGLANTRLSIIDLNTGHQPISNEDGTLWIVLNGEIYNYRELYSYLVARGHQFKTKSDTEVILHLYEEHGSACLEKLRGMFAFAIWDEKDETLFLARDRVGIKPLYYSLGSDSLTFGSEIKAILAGSSGNWEIAPEMIDRFLTFHYLPGAETLFRDIAKLPPGCYLQAHNGQVEIRQYWDLTFTKPSRVAGLAETEEQLRSLLAESVRLHMIADVPVGVLLSGGMDSTAVLSFAGETTHKQISTFTIGFADSGIPDERPYARLAAETYRSRHHENTISAADFAEFMPRYVWHMEEPVCEPPAVAMYYVTKLARNFVKVLLSGEGGDEAFGGYPHYRNILWLERFKRMLGPFNIAATKGLSVLNSVVNSSRIAKYLPLMDAAFPDYYYSKTSDLFRYASSGIQSLYCGDFARGLDREHTVEPVRKLLVNAKGQDVLDQMLYIDTKTWLPDDLLVKADKMTMANSVELRVPLLDHKILEFAASLPTNLKVRGLTTKFIAKKALTGRVPRAILERRKAGFPVPYESWLRKDLRGWVRDVLFDCKTLTRGYFRPKAIKDLVARNEQTGSHSKEIFCLLNLELWHRAFLQDLAVEPLANAQAILL